MERTLHTTDADSYLLWQVDPLLGNDRHLLLARLNFSSHKSFSTSASHLSRGIITSFLTSSLFPKKCYSRPYFIRFNHMLQTF
jgi:hypothetical protein